MTFIRKTKQRDAICGAFESADRPLSPEEVAAAAAEQVPNIGIATVYRNIAALVEEGWLTPVEIPGQASRYELSGKHHHHHFLCRGCEQMFEVDGCLKELSSLTPKGFVLEDHHITLYGLCSECS
ncbi:MAG: transcriptional repressor [Bdellovibrionales bacterium]|nr:transcriptional repressor [Bdellovibrionales bacterium]